MFSRLFLLKLSDYNQQIHVAELKIIVSVETIMIVRLHAVIYQIFNYQVTIQSLNHSNGIKYFIR